MNSPPAVKNSRNCSLNAVRRQIVTTDKKFNAISVQRQGIARAAHIGGQITDFVRECVFSGPSADHLPSHNLVEQLHGLDDYRRPRASDAIKYSQISSSLAGMFDEPKAATAPRDPEADEIRGLFEQLKWVVAGVTRCGRIILSVTLRWRVSSLRCLL